MFGVTPRTLRGGVPVLPLTGKPLLPVAAFGLGTPLSTVVAILVEQLKADTSASLERAAVSEWLSDREENPDADD